MKQSCFPLPTTPRAVCRITGCHHPMAPSTGQRGSALCLFHQRFLAVAFHRVRREG